MLIFGARWDEHLSYGKYGVMSHFMNYGFDMTVHWLGLNNMLTYAQLGDHFGDTGMKDGLFTYHLQPIFSTNGNNIG